MGTGRLSWGLALSTHPHSSAGVKEIRYTSTPFLGLHGLLYGESVLRMYFSCPFLYNVPCFYLIITLFIIYYNVAT